MTPQQMVAKLRVVALAGKRAERVHERPSIGPDDGPDPSLAEQCHECRDFGALVPRCALCGAHVVDNGSRGLWHAHGRAEGFSVALSAPAGERGEAVNIAQLRAALRYKRASFWERVLKAGPDQCWVWLGGRTAAGYGQVTVDGRHQYAHRRAYELVVGAIPPGLTIDHLCQNKACCNPAHMEVVTRGENARRGEKNRRTRSGGGGRQFAARTACSNGHDYTEGSYRTRGNTRICIPCARRRLREHRARRMAGQ